MITYICVIESLSAMLQHRFGDAEEMDAASRKVHIKTKDPRAEAEKCVYRNETGHLYVPGAAIARSLREAGAAHKQRGSRKSLKYVIPAAILIPEEQVILRDSEGNPLTEFEVDSRPVVIPATKGRIMRHRPRINKYWAEFHIEIDEDMLEPALIHQLLIEAGLKCGLLDYRPERGGPFGRFAVVSWQVLAQTVTAIAAE